MVVTGDRLNDEHGYRIRRTRLLLLSETDLKVPVKNFFLKKRYLYEGFEAKHFYFVYTGSVSSSMHLPTNCTHRQI